MFDLHMHTTWSDGKNTPEEMIEEAIRLGLETVGISDHSSGDPCGMTLEQSVEYRAEIAENMTGSEGDGVYAVESVVREGDEGLEPDNDRASDIANSWIFLD